MRVFQFPTIAILALWLGACGPLADKRYDYPAWGVSAVFPEPPKVDDEPATPGRGANFEAKLDDDKAQIKVLIVVDTAPGETVDSIARDHAARTAAAIQGDAGAPHVVTTPEGVVGREVRFSADGRPIFISRYFLVGRRLYEADVSAIDGFDDPFTAGFLNSLRITVRPPLASSHVRGAPKVPGEQTRQGQSRDEAAPAEDGTAFA